MMSRRSPEVRPAKIQRPYWCTFACTHSAPVRVFPHPLPARMSQVSQSPGGAFCSGLASSSHGRLSSTLVGTSRKLAPDRVVEDFPLVVVEVARDVTRLSPFGCLSA